MENPSKGNGPDELNSSGLFSSYAERTLTDLANTMLAVRIINCALSTFPKHWALLMSDETKFAEFLTCVKELWKDQRNEQDKDSV